MQWRAFTSSLFHALTPNNDVVGVTVAKAGEADLHAAGLAVENATILGVLAWIEAFTHTCGWKTELKRLCMSDTVGQAEQVVIWPVG